MQVTEQIDHTYLQQTPPRPLPYMVVLRLFGKHILTRPITTIFNPWLIVNLLGVIILIVLELHVIIWLIPLALLVAQICFHSYHLKRHITVDIDLLRKGIVIRAHILKLRAHRTLTGEINGALLDCAIPVTAHRTHIGSIWIADGGEALRLAHKGRVEVVCLPKSPGTWRVIEEIQSEVRYARMGTNT
ncbi:MAG: hypothetical protein GFH27_549319n66 [Chloroflexi bacterium AL-W]|nr:hypothetical protein [Chloroflexi bacterium AL-N1]NOK70612.1 hypothetical protein [Chloroflexi bacterium AL-N10]NOK77604.1 hypothetical protein [Chloroflexi bacterium AL-N5]NOK84455.1 hypothetical protein [Chloroflexi bacterium AL-W]NOK92344.1 hypothetical protein [Chloroflexi bacterium AL-N15]